MLMNPCSKMRRRNWVWVLLIGLTEAFVVPRGGAGGSTFLKTSAFLTGKQGPAFQYTKSRSQPLFMSSATDDDLLRSRSQQLSSSTRCNMTSVENMYIDELVDDDPSKLLRRQHLLEQRSARVNQIVWTNAGIVGSLALAALYQLLHVDLEAIAAVYEYGLGPHGGDLTRAAVALDLLARLPLDWLHNYEALVPTNPIFYKACTSGVAYALGDFISQIYQGRDLTSLDLPRSCRSGIAGFVGHGPLCHYWLLFMETNLDFNGAWWATGIKVTADLTVWAIFLNAAYSMIIGLLQFRSPLDVLKDVRATSWPALRSAWRFWPFVHTVSFSHAVPLDLKLLWVDAMEVVWVTILSKVANEDKLARLKENEQTKIETVDTDFGVDPALEIELVREQEMPDRKLSFELPQKALQACWPLIAMWPVLWAGYQVELALGLVHAA